LNIFDFWDPSGVPICAHKCSPACSTKRLHYHVIIFLALKTFVKKKRFDFFYNFFDNCRTLTKNIYQFIPKYFHTWLSLSWMLLIIIVEFVEFRVNVVTGFTRTISTCFRNWSKIQFCGQNSKFLGKNQIYG